MTTSGLPFSLVPRRSPTAPRLVACLLAAAASAQNLAEGHATSLRSLPAGTAVAIALPNGTAWFDGSDVRLEEPGLPPRSLLHFSAPRFGSFLLPIDATQLLFAESSLDEVWIVPLGIGAAPRLLTTIRFAYDAVPLGAARVLVSAKTGGFGAGANNLIAVDLASGAQTPIGLVAGSSGPLALDRHGDLLYATAPLGFPPPPGAVELLRWTAPQWSLALAGGPQLGRGNAQLVRGGLDSAADLALDEDDDVLFADWFNARIGECSDVHGAAAVTTLIDYAGSPVSPATLQFASAPAGPGLRQFEPFAAVDGGALLVLETDFAALSQLRRVAPAPAVATSTPAGTVPAGAFAIDLQGGPANGQALFVLGTVHTGLALPIDLGFEQVIAWDAGLLYPVLWSLQPCTGSGASQLALVNPGFAPNLPVHTQVLFATADGGRIGATDVTTTVLGQ